MAKKTKKVAPKKAAPKKTPTVKKVTPKKEVAKPSAKKTTKKVTVSKKVTVATPAPNASHRKQRGRTAPNRALSVTKKVTVKTVVSKETTKNKKTAPVKWNKTGPKKLPAVKPQPVKMDEPKLPAVQFAEQEAMLFDLTKPDAMRVKHPEIFNPDGSPKPWGSITPPFIPATASAPKITIPEQIQRPSANSSANWVGPEITPTAPAPQPVPTTAAPIWSVPSISTIGVSTSSATGAGWRTVVPNSRF